MKQSEALQPISDSFRAKANRVLGIVSELSTEVRNAIGVANFPAELGGPVLFCDDSVPGASDAIKRLNDAGWLDILTGDCYGDNADNA